MELDFDLANVALSEFGIGRDEEGGQVLLAVPADATVQAALAGMVGATVTALAANDAIQYDPSEKHGVTETLYLDLTDPLASFAKEMRDAANIPIESKALSDPDDIYCYFARMTDIQGRRISAVRRASQFKGILKSQLISWGDDTLRVVDDDVFKLDREFDFIVDSKRVHILHPAAFEFAGKLQEAIMASVSENIAAFQEDLAFASLESIQKYASKHPRAARFVASIKSNGQAKGLNKNLLKRACVASGFVLTESKGIVSIPAGHEMDFLEVIDRRRYALELVKGKTERYRAASRERVSNA